MSNAPVDVVAINGVRFVIKSSGFGQHISARGAAIGSLVASLGRHDPSVLGQLSPEALREAAGAAVRKETRDWRCWSPSYSGQLPELRVDRE